ncbi:MAG: hypothetical protein HKO59_05930 [Phycisphaerales bacterium]|nr:hypothetical protein [Phycisphaerales bacterium]
MSSARLWAIVRSAGLRPVAVVVVAMATSTMAHADTLHVPFPFATVQSAIDAADDGDEVLVFPGVYPESIRLYGKAITVRGALGAAVTVIDGVGESGSVVSCIDGEGDDTVLADLTICRGDATLGGGLHNSFTSPTVVRCVFTDNHASENGGAVYNQLGSPRFVDCVFRGNDANVFGGGIYNLGSAPDIINCVFTANQAGAGGGVNSLLGAPRILNCTFSGNEAFFAGAVRSSSNGSETHTTLRNCIIWANASGDGTEVLALAGAIIAIDYSIVAGGWPGAGNRDEDPAFAGTGPHPYRPGPGSPAIDAGDNTAVPADIERDLLGQPRFVDDAGTDDTGAGGWPVVDMGAYERLDSTACVGDLDGDGEVGLPDLVMVLTFWGPCDDCPADIDGNGFVDLGDLALVLVGWGSC